MKLVPDSGALSPEERARLGAVVETVGGVLVRSVLGSFAAGALFGAGAYHLVAALWGGA